MLVLEGIIIILACPSYLKGRDAMSNVPEERLKWYLVNLGWVEQVAEARVLRELPKNNRTLRED